MGKVLVLGDDSRAFLSVIRSLGRARLNVHIAWHGRDSIARRSKYVCREHELPPYSETQRRWLGEFIDLLRAEQFDLVIPCTDAAVAALQRNREEFSQYARLYLLGERAYETFLDKIRTHELASSVGVPVPRGRVISDAAQAGEAAGEFGFPLVLKPASSYDPCTPQTKRVVRKAYDEESLQRISSMMLEGGPILVQENVLGCGVGVELLLDSGKPVLRFQHVRVHEPMYGGGSSYRKSVPVSSELESAALSLLAPFAYTGVAMVEYKVNTVTGRWVLMEVNARFWGSLPLALAAGVDFPLGLYQLLVEGRVSVHRDYRTSIYCRNLTLDLAWQRANLRADRRDPTLATQPVARAVGQTIVNCLTLRERSDTLTWDDPRPGWEEIKQVWRRAFDGMWRRAAHASLRCRRARRRVRALSAVVGARRLLFVCKGNVCRSPFAEQYATKLGLVPEVASAGYLPPAGRRPPPSAIEAARHWEVDLATHRSQLVTAALLRQADVVLVFDYYNYQRLLTDFPFVRRRLQFLGVYAQEGPVFIEDPWGEDLERFKREYSRIAAALTTIAAARRSIISQV